MEIQLEEDHPHACGDKLPNNLVLYRAKGSSPRVWGQDALGCLVKQRSRIIPTRVGTSGDNTSLCNLTKDHPHACGDKRLMIYSLMQVYGSSPRVWGQVGMFESNYVDNEDHPHACGDKQAR